MKKKEQALVELIEALPTKSKIRGIEDLLSGVVLCNFMKAVLDEDTIHNLGLDELDYQNPDNDPNRDNARYFEQLLSALKQYQVEQNLGYSVEIDADRIIEQEDINELYRLIKYMFLLLTSRKELIECLTRLTKESQLILMKLIKESQNIVGKTRESTLLEDIEKLENQLAAALELNDTIKAQLRDSEEEKQRLEAIIGSLNAQLDMLKRHNWSLEELEGNMSAREMEVDALASKNHQLSNELYHQRLLAKDTAEQYEKQIDVLKDKLELALKENDKLDSRIADLEVIIRNGENDEKFQAIVSSLENKCQQMSEKIQVCQAENQDLLHELRVKEQQVSKHKDEIAHMESYIQQLQEERQAYLNNVAESKVTPRYLDASLKEKPPSQILPLGQCQKRECMNQKKQLQTLKKKYMQVITHVQTPNTNYVSECHRIIDQKSKIIEEYRDKLAKSTSQNLRLKEKIICNSTAHIYEANIAKLQAKNCSLKKKLEELHMERTRDYQSLTEVKKMYQDLRAIVRRCPLCAKIMRS